MNLGELLLSVLVGPLQTASAVYLSQLLMKIEPEETRKAAIVAMYSVVDAELEKLAGETKTKIDDAIIQGIKTALEDAAQKSGISLPNVDND